MTVDHSEGRWPFATSGRPLATRPFDPGTDDAVAAVVDAAADALDADPLALPTLNDRIDPDYLDGLVATGPSTPTDGVRVAVEVTFRSVAVLVRDDGRIEVYRDGREPDTLDPTVTAHHDWAGAESVLRSITRAVESAADDVAPVVTERLVERVDPDAINRLLRPLADGTHRVDSRLRLSVDGYEVAVDPRGEITVEPSLAALRRSGAALLLAGSVPEQGFDLSSAKLLGDPETECRPVFVLHGRDVDTARRRLSMAGLSPSAGTVLDHRATARGGATAASEAAETVEHRPSVVPVSGDIEAIPEAVRETVGEPALSAPGELRLCVDSLASMIDASGLEATRGEILQLCRLVREHQGIGQFHLPHDAGDEAVQALAPSFDAVVELRTGDAGVEQRWRLTATGYETGWFAVR